MDMIQSIKAKNHQKKSHLWPKTIWIQTASNFEITEEIFPHLPGLPVE